jgi:solute carrier family 25 uncoupling protein 27
MLSPAVTYPLDLTKTRMQIAGELEKNPALSTQTKRLGMFRTALGVVRNEGMMQLWSGLSPALYRHVIYSGIRMALYEKIRDDIFGREPDGSYPVHKVKIYILVKKLAEE